MRRITPLITAPTMSTQNDTPAPQWHKIIGLLDWAESILCNTQPMPHWTQAEHDEALKKWRDKKHELFPLGQFTPQPTAPTAQPDEHSGNNIPNSLKDVGTSAIDDPCRVPVESGPATAHVNGPAATGTPDVGETPRTDAEEYAENDHGSKFMVVDADFARQLERDLNAARAEVERLTLERDGAREVALIRDESRTQLRDLTDQIAARDGVIARQHEALEYCEPTMRKCVCAGHCPERVYDKFNEALTMVDPATYADKLREAEAELTAMRGLLRQGVSLMPVTDEHGDIRPMSFAWIKESQAHLATERKEDGK